MSKPYQFPESSYLNLEPTRQSSAEQHRYAAEQDDEEEIGFSTRNDFNNKPTRNSRLSLAYSCVPFTSIPRVSSPFVVF